MNDAHGVARDQLRAFVERIERLAEEAKTIADDIRDVKAEAKSMGYSVKAINQLLKLRKMDDQQRMEEEMVLSTYLQALGMIPDFEPEAQSAPAETRGSGSAAPLQMRPGTVSELHRPDTTREGHDGDPSPTLAVRDLAEVGTGQNCAVLPQEPYTAEIATASQGEAEAPSSDERKSPADGMSGEVANTGGSHVDTHEDAATHQAGGLVKNPPAKHSALILRPHCQHPGEEICPGFGRNHCRACAAAAGEGT